MPDDTIKKEPILEVPFWFLQINSKINKNQKRFVFKIMYVFIGLYVLTPLSQSLLTILQEKNYEIFYYYIVFYTFYFIVLYLLLNFVFKKREVEEREVLAYAFYSLYLSYKKISYDTEIESSLKQNINNITQTLKRIKKSKLLWGDEALLKSFKKCIDNIDKIHYLKKNFKEHSLLLCVISESLCKLSEMLYHSEEIKTKEIKEEFQHIATGLENIKIPKLWDRVSTWKQSIIDYFPIYGFVIVIVMGVATVISLFHYKEYFTFISPIFSAFLVVWLQRFYKGK
jgi:hypothetical protein